MRATSSGSIQLWVKLSLGLRAKIRLASQLASSLSKKTFPFGRSLKSNTARALRRSELSGEQVERLRKRIVSMFLAGNVPHEFKEYAKLLRKIGLGEWWPAIERQAPYGHYRAARYFRYFLELNEEAG